MKKLVSLLFCVTTFLFIGCNFTAPKIQNRIVTKETMHLYKNLLEVQKQHILFGHHDANAYGHGWKNERGRTDVKDVCGSHPAVYGHDFSSITTYGLSEKQLKKNADQLRILITEAYEQGGVNTITWHFRNPAVENGSFYHDENIAPTLPRLLPNNDLHERYKQILQQIATFAQSCKGKEGELIPLIFRPYHEYDGNWFWWGTPHHATTEEFKSLWRFTHSYLTDTLGVSNFIYAISPDCKFNSEEEFLSCYPGDEYVDMIAMDNYWDLRPDGGSKANFVHKLSIVNKVAQERGKIAALSETGLEGIPEENWWTETLLRLLQEQPLQLAYVMVWRNAHDIPTHFYAPFPGQKSADDFVKFRNHNYMLFGDDIKNIYSKNFKILKKASEN